MGQYVICCAVVFVVALFCGLAEGLIGHDASALILLMAVSLLAMVFSTGPVLLSATLSALVWNFFFIPPVHTFHINSTHDVLMFLLYFVIALVNAVLTLRIRYGERQLRVKEEQQRSIALYGTLFNSLSHELRTPIAAIVGSVDTLQQHDVKLTVEQRSDLLGTIDEAGARLDRQVENLLNMGRLESGMLRPRADWCDVNEVIVGVLREVKWEDDHTLLFVPDGGLPLFKLDGGLLQQLLHNLIHNAVAYTPAGATIIVAVTHTAGGCRITVADNGPGFPEFERSRAFDKFYRLPRTARGGSGLGLSIVKGFVEAMGGTVTLEANAPRGAHFTIDLPAETSFLSNLKHE
jgi:two-component system sensor histidine kinase KdpD